MKGIRNDVSSTKGSRAILAVFVLLAMIPLDLAANSTLDAIDITLSDSDIAELSGEQQSEGLMSKLENDKSKRQKYIQSLKEENERNIAILLGEEIDFSINETETWINENRDRLLHILVFITLISILYVVYWRLNMIQRRLEQQAKEVNSYADELEKILGKGKRLGFVTWRDQKAGILFVPNPMHTKRKRRRQDKKTELKTELKKLKKQLIKKSDDIDTLKEKLNIYLDTIDRLNQEYEENRKKIISDHRYNEPEGQVTREFR